MYGPALEDLYIFPVPHRQNETEAWFGSVQSLSRVGLFPLPHRQSETEA